MVFSRMNGFSATFFSTFLTVDLRKTTTSTRLYGSTYRLLKTSKISRRSLCCLRWLSASSRAAFRIRSARVTRVTCLPSNESAAPKTGSGTLHQCGASERSFGADASFDCSKSLRCSERRANPLKPNLPRPASDCHHFRSSLPGGSLQSGRGLQQKLTATHLSHPSEMAWLMLELVQSQYQQQGRSICTARIRHRMQQ